jgi:alpha-tubulin suppressor-like RCC1 family protein
VTDLSSFHVRSVAAGAAHTLALTHEGEVWAWGLAADGRLGLAGNGAQHGASGEVVSRPRRVRLGAAQPEAGGSGGRARVGGEVPFRQQLGAALQAALALGVRHEQRRATPEPPPPAAHRVVALSAGTGSHCLAVTDDGLLWSWGRSEPVRALPHPASRAVVASALPSRVPDQEGREGAPPPLRLCA